MSEDVKNLDPSLWVVEKDYPSVFGQAHNLIDEVLAKMTEQGWSDRDVFAVNMALEESVTNAIEHGNHGNPEKRFYLVCRVSPKLVYISVRDEGKGFQRDLVPDPTKDENLETPSGRGMMLINGFMTRVWYNEAGNEIYMEKEPTV